MSNEGKGPVPARLDNNHRAYTLTQINELRHMFAAQKPADALRFLPASAPRRSPSDTCRRKFQRRQRQNDH